MTNETLGKLQSTDDEQWLQSYYLLRAAVAGVWVGAAFVFATNVPVLAAALLLIYPAWDAAANIMDARRHGGAKANPTQALNAVVSLLTTGAVAIALAVSMNAVLGVFGVWATLAGLFQLATAVRRWKSRGAQWAMILSGGQSMLVGVMFIRQASAAAIPGIGDIAPYAAFGSFYFLISAVWLAASVARHRRVRPTAGRIRVTK
jgi:uncharacterized membrane protein HdeD (DUF308 family)